MGKSAHNHEAQPPLSFEDFQDGLGFELPTVSLEQFENSLGFDLPPVVLSGEPEEPAYDEIIAPEPELPKMFNFNDESRRAEILKNGEVHGDIGLRIRELDAMGLGPKHELNLDYATTINFSDVYKYGSRMAVVGYVTKRSTAAGNGTVDSETVARTYYMSGSQGVWRYLPSHSDKSWYNKGHSEDSLAVPFEAQAMLGQIADLPHAYVADSERPFFGTARSTIVEPGITYQREVSRNPIKLEGNFYNTPSGHLIPPTELEFQPDSVQAPDFEKEPLFNWKASTNSISDVQFEVYPSRDGRLNYVFCRTEQNEAWLAYVEDESEVTSLGVRSNWIRTGDLATPITEYDSQDGGYGVQAWGNYVNMWPHYLSKVPVLQRYLGVTKARAAIANRF